jgi:hypothetical protein
MAKASSIRMAPMKNVQFSEREKMPRSKIASGWCRGIIAAVAPASSSTLPAAAWVAMY